MPTAIKVLISHAHEEKGLAEAWKALLDTVSLGVIETWYSSDTTAQGGIGVGEDWRQQIYTKLADSDFVVAIQTPTSTGRPWIMWECGVGSGIDRSRGIIPIAYVLGRGDLANPLSSYQVYQGEDNDQVREVCERLLTAAGLRSQSYSYDEPLKVYGEKIRLHKPRRPLRQEEMRLWTSRFEELIQVGRIDEVIPKRQAMYASLEKPFAPVEPSIHELLSRVLIDEQHFDLALEEANYALQLVPGDIEVLHRKALALAETHNLAEVEAILSRVFEEHPELHTSPELASLEGRIHRERWQTTGDRRQLDRAFEAYHRAYDADRTQYFPGINAGSLALAKGDTATATTVFLEVLATCGVLQQRSRVSFWVDFTAGEAQLGLDRSVDALASYERALSRMPAPSPRERESTVRGARRIIKAKGLDEGVADQIEEILR